MSHRVFPARSLPYCVALPLSLAFIAFVSAPPLSAAPLPPAVTNQVLAIPQTQLIVAQGIVLDPNGKPLKGASVVAPYMGQESRDLAQPVVQTDERGHFTLETPIAGKQLTQLRSYFRTSETEFPLVVLVHAPGYAAMEKRLKGASRKSGNLPPNEVKLARGFDTTGRVADANDRPMAGVKVQAAFMDVEGEDQDTPDGSMAFLEFGGVTKDSPFLHAFQTTSDAAGHFTLHDLPKGSLNVSLIDPRFVSQGVSIKVDGTADPGQLPTLTARPASSLRGRVLYPDGKPVTGVQVTVFKIGEFNRMVAMNMVGNDGTYTFEGIEAGKVMVSVAAPSPEWAATTSQAAELTAGAETKLDDLTLTRGIVIAGSVRDKETKAPVEGVNVEAYVKGGSNPLSATTDKQGRYQMRVQPGRYQFSIPDAPLDFLKNQEAQPELTVVDETQAAPDFVLRRGITLTGTAQDEKGQPANGAIISLANGGFDLEARVDEKGNWTLYRIDPTRFYGGQDANTAKLRISGDWSLPGNPTVKLSAPPLALVLHHVQLQNVKVRAVTTQGQLVAGATISYPIYLTDTGDTWSDGTATTDAHGEAVLKGLRPETPVEFTATKQGYTLAQKGKIAHQGGEPGNVALVQTQDLVLASLNAKVMGRVLDAQGQPAKGARVALLSPNDLRDLPDNSVLTNDQGQFTLEGLPQGELLVGAAQGRAYGQSVTQANGTLELKLGTASPVPAPQDAAAAFSLLDQWIQAAREEKGVAEKRDEGIIATAIRLTSYDADRAQRLMTDDQGNLNQAYLGGAPANWAHQDPQHAVVWGRKVLLLTKEPAALTNAELRLAALTATADPVWARQVYDEVAGATPPNQLSAKAASRYAQLAALAGALHDPDANGWSQALVLCMNAMTEQERRDNTYQSVVTLANGDLPTARRWVAQLPPLMQVTALSQLIGWATKYNLPAAQQMVGDLDALIQRPDFPPAKPRDEHTYALTPADMLTAARTEVAAALLNRDPRAVQKFVDTLPARVLLNGNLKSEIQFSTAGVQDEQTLKDALAKFKEQWWYSAGNTAFLASLLSDTLPQLSAQAFKDARDKLANRENTGRNDEDGAAYAYARVQVAPEESRLLLESEWLRVTNILRHAKETAEKDQSKVWQAQASARAVIKAMIPLSIERTNEMIQEGAALSDELATSTRESRLRIIDWLLVDAQTRRTTPLRRETEDWDIAD